MINTLESVPVDLLEQSYLLFRLNQSLYGIETSLVEEIFFLPELTPITDTPREIVGVINLREDIIPVMDLHLRFGYHPPEYQLTDSLIILKFHKLRLGIIVNQVLEVRAIPPAEITQKLSYSTEDLAEESIPLYKGIAHSRNDIISLLNVEILVHSLEAHPTQVIQKTLSLNAEELDEMAGRDQEGRLLEWRVFCPSATPEIRQIFQERAEHLRQVATTENLKGFKPLAVISFGKEFFGIDLKIVREFTEIDQVTPIPCCPPYFVGNINLRGEIVTLLDVAQVLNLPAIPWEDAKQAMVIEAGELVIGVLVEGIYDVLLLDPRNITTVPTAIHSINDEYLLGAAVYQDKMMSILDLEKMLLKGNLVVDETIQ
ncbi:chemotaxis protein CheW [Spirulina subsalsa]|uniref:chemotaxis protein CheW n=1 Tax=Spirulina subsalsa TaxID=54311 RepID=UPI0002E59066|nr:chemotaxis protein CheW [Spirulina subsalsa]